MADHDAPPLAPQTGHTADCDLLFAQFRSYMVDRGERYPWWHSRRGCGCEKDQPPEEPPQATRDTVASAYTAAAENASGLAIVLLTRARDPDRLLMAHAMRARFTDLRNSIEAAQTEHHRMLLSEQPRAAPSLPLADLPEKEK